MIAAVRVPPSACSTSQSMTIVFSPSASVDHGAKCAADQARDLMGSAADLARTDSRSFRVLRGARQHRVLGRDPAQPAPPAPPRHTLGE